MLAMAVLGACSGPLAPTSDEAIGALPERVVAPADRPVTPDRVALGRLLFWDPILSGDRDVACASCHHPDLDYADGRARSLGAGAAGLGPRRVPLTGPAREVARNAPTILDAAWNGLATVGALYDPARAPMFWDSRALSLEAQAEGPLLAAAEMRGHAIAEADLFDVLIDRLNAIPEYRDRFTAAFGGAGIDRPRIVQAIASFERTLVMPDTSFDRFMAGDVAALDPVQRRGLIAFYDSGCASCHAGPMFSDFKLHHLGVMERDAATGEQRDSFRTSSLRHVTHTAPYLHDGSVATLTEMMVFYRRVDRSGDDALRDLQPVSSHQSEEIIRFLDALGDGIVDRAIPAQVPRGLPVGPPAAVVLAAAAKLRRRATARNAWSASSGVKATATILYTR